MVQCVYIGIITYETQLGNKQVAQTQRKIKLNYKTVTTLPNVSFVTIKLPTSRY